MLKNLTSPDEVRASFRAYTHLRPHLDEETFVQQALRQLEQGYIITAILEDDLVVAVAGYRFMEALAWGKYIYIDDLVTHPDTRGKGYGGQLLDFIKELAIEHHLDAIHLDSGPTRLDAHRLYHSHRYFISAHHFTLNLPK